MSDRWSYRDAVKYLERRVVYRKTLGNANLSTAPVRKLLRAMKDPQQSFPAVYVSGTSGKGSVATFLAGILRSAGYRTGLILSPHVVSYTERVQLNGAPITQKDFAEHIKASKRIVETIQENDPLYQASAFEVLVAAQFLYFQHQHADIVVVETGLGGPKDATTTANAIVDVLTSVSLEHQRFLGRTIGEIAKNEGKGLHRGADQVIGTMSRVAQQAISPYLASDALKIGKDIHAELVALSVDGTTCNVAVGDTHYDELYTPLVGTFHVNNIALAVGAIMQLRRRGYDISDKAVRSGIRRVKIKDRFEVRKKNGRVIVLDGAHNPEKMQAMVLTFQHVFPRQRATIVLAVKKDKDITSIIRKLLPIARRIIATELSVACYSVRDIAKRARSIGFRGQIVCKANPSDAIKKCERDSFVLVTGSLYLYNDIIRYV